MEGIEHRMLNVNGINMHVAEKGQKGHPVVLFLHGFPELWYTWRRQISALAALGYHAVAPDLRGYGDTGSPAAAESYTCLHVVGDMIALLDALEAHDKVFLVGHDWGAQAGWYLCLFRPDRVTAFVALTVPFSPRRPKMKPVESMRAFFGEEYYMCRFQKPGEIEAEIAKYGTGEVLKKILTDRKPGPPRLPKENPFGISPNASPPLPSWISEDDLKYYADKFEHKGFTGGLNYYRALDLPYPNFTHRDTPWTTPTGDCYSPISLRQVSDAIDGEENSSLRLATATLRSLKTLRFSLTERNWELMAPWTGARVNVPVKFIVGDQDMVYTTPGVKEYVHSIDGFKKDVPLLEEPVVMEGAGHFLNQEKAEEVNTLIHDFIKKF